MAGNAMHARVIAAALVIVLSSVAGPAFDRECAAEGASCDASYQYHAVSDASDSASRWARAIIMCLEAFIGLAPRAAPAGPAPGPPPCGEEKGLSTGGPSSWVAREWTPRGPSWRGGEDGHRLAPNSPSDRPPIIPPRTGRPGPAWGRASRRGPSCRKYGGGRGGGGLLRASRGG
jgi:hypothetical protein